MTKIELVDFLYDHPECSIFTPVRVVKGSVSLLYAQIDSSVVLGFIDHCYNNQELNCYIDSDGDIIFGDLLNA